MSITIKFMTILVKKSAVQRHYHGGELAFRSDFPQPLEDGYLFGIVSMSGSDTQYVLDLMKDKGLELDSACAIADMHHGPIEPHPHFLFRNTSLDFPPQWECQLIGDVPEVLAEDGANLLAWLMKSDVKLDIPPYSS